MSQMIKHIFLNSWLAVWIGTGSTLLTDVPNYERTASKHNGEEYFPILTVILRGTLARVFCCVTSNATLNKYRANGTYSWDRRLTTIKSQFAHDPGFISVFVKWYLLGQQRFSGVHDRIDSSSDCSQCSPLWFLLQCVNAAAWMH